MPIIPSGARKTGEQAQAEAMRKPKAANLRRKAGCAFDSRRELCLTGSDCPTGEYSTEPPELRSRANV